MGRSWVGFDMDGTLHDFRASSAEALKCIVDRICGDLKVERNELLRHYQVLAEGDSRTGFSENLSSAQYRRRRLQGVLAKCGSEASEDYVSEAVQEYENCLARATKVFPDAPPFLNALKQRGLSIAVITEGPEDAQQRAVERLGLSMVIDLLVTSSKYGRSKTDGLFAVARQRMGIKNDERPYYFGDSLLRDVVPALQSGFTPVLVARESGYVLRGEHATAPARVIRTMSDALDLFD